MATLVDVGKIVTDVGLVVAFILFSYMIVKSANPDMPRWKSLRFGFSVASLVWLAAESLMNWAPVLAPLPAYSGDIGRYIHLTSMAIFASYVFLKARIFLRP